MSPTTGAAGKRDGHVEWDREPLGHGLDWVVCAGRVGYRVPTWIYVSCSKTPGSAAAAGACVFPIPGTVAAGTYELRLFSNNGFTKLAASNALTVN